MKVYNEVARETMHSLKLVKAPRTGGQTVVYLLLSPLTTNEAVTVKSFNLFDFVK